MIGAVFIGSYLSNTNFDHADLTAARLNFSTLRGTRIIAESIGYGVAGLALMLVRAATDQCDRRARAGSTELVPVSASSQQRAINDYRSLLPNDEQA